MSALRGAADEPAGQEALRLGELRAHIARATAEIRQLEQQLALVEARQAGVRHQVEAAQRRLAQLGRELEPLDARQEVATPTFGAALGKTVGALLTELAAAADAELIYVLQGFELELFSHLQPGATGEVCLRLPGCNEPIQPAGLSRLRVRLGPLARDGAGAGEGDAYAS